MFSEHLWTTITAGSILSSGLLLSSTWNPHWPKAIPSNIKYPIETLHVVSYCIVSTHFGSRNPTGMNWNLWIQQIAAPRTFNAFPGPCWSQRHIATDKSDTSTEAFRIHIAEKKSLRYRGAICGSTKCWGPTICSILKHISFRLSDVKKIGYKSHALNFGDQNFRVNEECIAPNPQKLIVLGGGFTSMCIPPNQWLMWLLYKPSSQQ